MAKALVDMGRGGEERNDGGITTSNNGEDDNDDCKLAAKPTVVDNGVKEGVEKTFTALNNVVIKEWDAETVADGGKNNHDFEGDGNDLGWGKEETMLIDGAMDTGSNAGADKGLVDNMDEIGEETMLTDGAMDPVSNTGANNGLVDDFDEIGEDELNSNGLWFAPECRTCFKTNKYIQVGKKLCLHPWKEQRMNGTGQYILFNSTWFRRGYFNRRSKSVYMQAQLFAVSSDKPDIDRHTHSFLQVKMSDYVHGILDLKTIMEL